MKDNRWDPTQYRDFEKERKLPFYDLLKLIVPQDAMTVVDLGCGTGQLTKVLHDTLIAKDPLGIDSSEEMLQEAQALSRAHSRVLWRGQTDVPPFKRILLWARG